MLITVDFNSEEAIYMQLRNQIIMGIATSVIREGNSLPLYGSWQILWESICTQ